MEAREEVGMFWDLGKHDQQTQGHVIIHRVEKTIHAQVSDFPG